MMATQQISERRQTRSSVRLRDHEAEFQKDLEAALEISRVTYDREKDLRQGSDEPANANEANEQDNKAESKIPIRSLKRQRTPRQCIEVLADDNTFEQGKECHEVEKRSFHTVNVRNPIRRKKQRRCPFGSQFEELAEDKPSQQGSEDEKLSNLAHQSDDLGKPPRPKRGTKKKKGVVRTRSGFTEVMQYPVLRNERNEDGDPSTLVHQPIDVGSLAPPKRSKKRKKKDFVRTHFRFDEPAECKEASPEGQARSTEEDIYLLVDDEDDFRQLPDGEIIADDCLKEQSTSGNKIAYPSSDDLDAVELDEGVLQCLEEMEYLNDTVIDFYIKYMQVSKNSAHQEQFHVFNSFFYKRLARAVCPERSLESTDEMCKLRKWIKGINIFEKAYLIMPIHDNQHWSLAIVCFLRSGSYEPCFILHLDSMKTGHNSRVVFEVLRRYLLAEWRSHSSTGDARAGVKVASKHIRVKKVKVPQQDNEYDCGLYLLHFIERFLAKAPSRFGLSMVKDMFDWFQPNEASELRVVIRHLIQGILEAVNVNGGDTLVEKTEEPGDSQDINQETADVEGCREVEGIQDTSKECQEINEKSASTQDLDGGDVQSDECKELEDGSTGNKDWKMPKADHKQCEEDTRSKKSKGRVKCFERRRSKKEKGEEES